LDDCRCEGRLVGGMTRILPLVEQLRDSLNMPALVDAGDFLSSYSYPDVNRAMLRLLKRAEYDALNLGDQEFVEGSNFLERWQRAHSRRLPLVSANTELELNGDGLVAPYNIVRKGKHIIAVIGLVEEESFEFISSGGMTVTATRDRLHTLRFLASETDIQLLLYHGDKNKLPALVREHDWLDAVIVGNNQQLSEDIENRTLIVESGTDGEHIGLISATFTRKKWRMANKFFEITRELQTDKKAIRISAPFYGAQ
ncbi:MAG: hypothetical protein AAFP70_19735, partial [Calditrichota bacterium]